MPPSPQHLQRAHLLVGQSRYKMAIDELRMALAEDPGSPDAHALLALCLSETEAHAEAYEAAGKAIGFAPDWYYAHFVLARVELDRNRFAESRRAIDAALALAPDEANCHAFSAALYSHDRRWEDALKAAENGLQMDGEHIGCANLRATALIKLGRKDEANDALDAALHRDPDNAYTHGTRGWALLQQGKPKEAMEHFREALRLDPESESARSGIVEAMKAKNFLYRWLLKWFFWIGKLGQGRAWMVILGAWLGVNVLVHVGESYPTLEPYIEPITIAYLALVVVTLLGVPLSNLLLRIDRFGRLALSDDQRRGSTWFGMFFVLAMAHLAWWIFGEERGEIMGELGFLRFGLLLIPLSGIWFCDQGWPRWAMAALTALLFVLGMITYSLLVWIFFFEGKVSDAHLPTIHTINDCFMYGCFLSTWAINVLAGITPKK